MTKPSIATAMAVAATVWISSGTTASGQEESDQRFGTVHFATSCNETAQRRFDRAMRYQHSFWYRAVEGDVRGGAQGRSGMRHRLLGHRAEPAQQSARAAAGRQPSARPCGASRRPRRSAPRRSASAISSMRLPRLLHRLRQGRPSRARAGLSQGHGGVAQSYPDDDEAQIFYAIALNVAASPSDKTYANQLKGRRDPGADLQAPAAASRRRSLSDPPLRHAGAGGERASTRPSATRRSRRRRRTRSTCRRTSSPASATGRNRSRPTPPRRGRQRPARSSTTSCTPWTTWSMPICSSGRMRKRRRSSMR